MVADAPQLLIGDRPVTAEQASPGLNAMAWATEKLDQILLYRYQGRLPTIMTCGPLDSIDPRLLARLMDSSRSTVFCIEAPSFHGRLRARTAPVGVHANRPAIGSRPAAKVAGPKQ